MDWTKGYSSHWRIYEVDPVTWMDNGILEGVYSASVERTSDGTAPLLESGTLEFDADVQSDFRERYLRIALYAEQNGVSERIDIATLLCSSTTGHIDKGADFESITGRSVLYPASVKMMISGGYAPKGADGPQWAADILEECVSAPIDVVGSFTLSDHVVFDVGMTYLECAWKILDAGGFVMQIAGNGRITIRPIPKEPALILNEVGIQLVRPSISYELDYSYVPNRYTAIDGINVATATNDDPDSVTSTVYRGYIYDEIDESPTRVDGETLMQYAERRLEEKSMVTSTRTYNREYDPNVRPFDVVRGKMDEYDLEGDLRVVAQSINCGKGIVVNEKVQQEVYSWRRT